MNIYFNILKSIISGLATGIGICIPLGPAGIESIKRTLSKNFIEGFKVSLGAIAADMTYLLIINLGLSSLFLKSPKAEALFWIFCGAILVLFTLLCNNKNSGDNKCHKFFNNTYLSPFPAGFIITFLNPLTPSLWIALSGTVISVWRIAGYIYFYSFIFSILVGMITWFALLNLFAAKGVKMLNPNTASKTSVLLKYILLIIGLSFIIWGIIKFII